MNTFSLQPLTSKSRWLKKQKNHRQKTLSQSVRPTPKASVLVGLLTFFASSSAFANVDTPTTDHHTPLPKLESINQLGDLQPTTPAIERFFTQAGTPVILVRTHQLPMVDISVAFGAGSAFDTVIRPDGFGIANMTATMLTQGTQTLDEDAFVTASEELGISLNASASRDGLSINLRSLSDKDTLSSAVQLMASTLQTPAFDEKILARNKSRLITSLKQNEQRPSYVANLAFADAVFGSHPYAHPTTGTPTSVATLSQADLQAFKARFLVASNAKITITGDISQQDAQHIAETLTHALPVGEPAPALPAPATPNAGRIHIQHNSPQTSVIIGHLSDPRATTPSAMQDAAYLMLGNDVLAGGEFSARLMDDIRVKKGYTYGIYGNSTRMQASGLYTISFSANNDVVQNAINDTLAVVQNTLDNGISTNELTLAKNNAINSQPMRFASNAGIHSTASLMNFYGLPDSYITDSTARIEQTNLDKVNQSLRHNIKPDSFIIVTAGGEAQGQAPSQTQDATKPKTQP